MLRALCATEDIAISTFHGISAPNIDVALWLATSQSNAAAMKALLEDGASIDVRWGLGDRTPLSLAVDDGLTRSVRILIDSGADLEAEDDLGLTPLLKACSLGKKKGSMMALMLIEAGANVHFVRKDDEMTALKFAVRRSSPEVLVALLERGVAVDGPDGTDQTALMLAAREGNIESIKVLLEYGANAEAECLLPWAKGLTAAGLARLEGKKKVVEFFSGLG